LVCFIGILYYSLQELQNSALSEGGQMHFSSLFSQLLILKDLCTMNQTVIIDGECKVYVRDLAYRLSACSPSH